MCTFDNLSTCFRSPTIDLQARQSFILQGVCWKGRGKPFEGLTAAELRQELRARGLSDKGKTKIQMEQQLTMLRKGIQKFPALLRTCPEKRIQDVELGEYEISPCEPLHGLEGPHGQSI